MCAVLVVLALVAGAFAALGALIATGAWAAAAAVVVLIVIGVTVATSTAFGDDTHDDADDDGDGGLGVPTPDRPRSSPDGPAIDWEAFDRARRSWDRPRSPAR